MMVPIPKRLAALLRREQQPRSLNTSFSRFIGTTAPFFDALDALTPDDFVDPDPAQYDFWQVNWMAVVATQQFQLQEYGGWKAAPTLSYSAVHLNQQNKQSEALCTAVLHRRVQEAMQAAFDFDNSNIVDPDSSSRIPMLNPAGMVFMLTRLQLVNDVIIERRYRYHDPGDRRLKQLRDVLLTLERQSVIVNARYNAVPAKERVKYFFSKTCMDDLHAMVHAFPMLLTQLITKAPDLPSDGGVLMLATIR